MTNIHIQKSCFALDDIEIFPISGSSNNTRNGIDNYSSDEEFYDSNNTCGTQFDSSNSLSCSFFQ